jgi:Uma2 family endonuclease
MVGASDTHGLIALSIASELRRHLRGGPCQVFIADMKVRIEAVAEDHFYYPDVLVSCAAADRERFFRRSPCLIVEVLSAATERLDRGEKFQAFRQLESLQEFVLVSQDQRLVEVVRRETDWRPEYYGDGDNIPLRSVKMDLPVAVVYEDL